MIKPNGLDLDTFQLHLDMSVFKLRCQTLELVLSIKGLDLWWVELEFLDAIYHGYDSLSTTIYYDIISLGGLSSPLKIKKRTWQLERRISSFNSDILFMMESGTPKPSFHLILIKRLLLFAWILYEIIIRFNNWYQSLLFIG